MKTISEFRKAIIIGYGSIGKHHANYLKDLANSVIVIDPKLEHQNLILEKTNYPNPKFFESLELLNAEISKEDIVVVANWGPDHYKTVKNAITKGAKKIVLEKPCADSLMELDNLKFLATDANCSIIVNHYWYHLNLGTRINALSKVLNLGDVVALWITGGARCISTAGSHWINLANQIYSSNPINIFASGNNGRINPRNENLAYYDGIFYFEYSYLRRLAINLTNLSSIAGKIEIFWRDAVGQLNGDKIKILKREEKSISTKITLYGDPVEVVFNGIIPQFESLEPIQIKALYDSFSHKTQIQLLQDLDLHLDTSKAIIYSLISSELGRKIQFGSPVESRFYNKKFMIS